MRIESRIFLIFALSALAWMWMTGPAGASIVVLQGADDMDDVWIYDHRYLGSTNDVQIQRSQWVKHVLFRFDFSSIPSGPTTVIDSAVLDLTCCNARADHSSVPIDVHFITNPWDEYGCSWNTRQDPTPGDANSGDEVPWDTAGGDYDANIEATLYLPAVDAWTHDYLTEFTPLVQAWVSGSVPNHGMLLKYREEHPDPADPLGFMWASSEWLAHVQPVLTIEYHVIPEPATTALMAMGLGLLIRRRRRGIRAK